MKQNLIGLVSLLGLFLVVAALVAFHAASGSQLAEAIKIPAAFALTAFTLVCALGAARITQPAELINSGGDPYFRAELDAKRRANYR